MKKLYFLLLILTYFNLPSGAQGCNTSTTNNVIECDYYEWLLPAGDGLTHTVSGVYTHTYLTSANCVHTETLNLTINYNTSSTTVATAACSYTWALTGETHTISGMYTTTSYNAAGCIQTDILDLTIYCNTYSTEYWCDTTFDYTWACNNITYHEYGAYTCTSINAYGAIHTTTLIYGPLADPLAYFEPIDNICASLPVEVVFNSNGTQNAANYFWDFGDGSVPSTDVNPIHTFINPGTFLVCLSISNADSITECTKTDSMCRYITVASNLPVNLECIGTVCAGDTATYCTDVVCNVASPYTWTVSGGSILSGQNTNCITVVWGSGNPQGKIKVVIGCQDYCIEGTTFDIPIIPNSTIINGNNPVCINSTNTYSLPQLPGVVYNWVVNGNQLINGNNTNTESVEITWTALGDFIITCNYFDSMKNCGGTGTLLVHVLPALQILGPSILCVDQVGTYYSNTGSTNVLSTWTINPAIANFVDNGTSATLSSQTIGTFTLTAISNLACQPTSQIIQVVAKPHISNIEGDEIICPGEKYMYKANSDGIGMFVWSITGGTGVTFGDNHDSIEVTWDGSWPFSIDVSQTSKVGNCMSNVITKNIDTFAAPIINGQQNVCVDAIVSYTINNISNTYFNFFIYPAKFGTILSAPGVNPVVVKWHGNNMPGTSNMVRLHYGVCNDDSIEITIHEPANLLISSNGTLCGNPGIELSTLASGIISWSHIENPLFTSTANPLTSIYSPGHYTLQVENVNGTPCTVNATYHIPAVGLPVSLIYAVGGVTYCAPAIVSATLHANQGTNYTYAWYEVGSPTPPVLSTNHEFNVNPNNNTWASSTKQYYCVVNLNGCIDTSNIITIKVQICTPGGTNGNGTGVGCLGTMTVTHSGCNPFTVTRTITNGVSFIASTEGIEHMDDNTHAIGDITKTYTSIGEKLINIYGNILMSDGSSCKVSAYEKVLVTLFADFITNVNCGTIQITNLSTILSPYSMTYQWSVNSSGSFNNATIANPELTVSSSGTYEITLIVTGSNGCSVTITKSVTITLPNADFNINPVSCVGTVVGFDNLISQYKNKWDFGDGSNSLESATEHAYTSSGIFLVTHHTTDLYGCIHSITKPIQINATPVCTILPNGLLEPCEGELIIVNASLGFTDYVWYKDGAPIIGALNSSAYTLSAIQIAQSGQYYCKATNANSCEIFSDTLTIRVKNIPDATITFIGKPCANQTYTLSAVPCTNCEYTWKVDGAQYQSGLSNTYSNIVGASPFSSGIQHTIELIVVGDNGCSNSSTQVIDFYENPSVTISAGSAPYPFCSSNTYTFTATSSTATSYAWTYGNFNSVLSSTTTLQASTAGQYVITVKDVNGCTAQAFENILPTPPLNLFPLGCDTLCDTSHVYFPIASLNGDISNYSISWYDNASPYNATTFVGTGASLDLDNLPTGSHHFSVIVVNLITGCTDTTNVYHVTTINCGCPEVTIKALCATDVCYSTNIELYVEDQNGNAILSNQNPYTISWKLLPSGPTYTNLSTLPISNINEDWEVTVSSGPDCIVKDTLDIVCCDSLLVEIFHNCPPGEDPCDTTHMHPLRAKVNGVLVNILSYNALLYNYTLQWYELTSTQLIPLVAGPSLPTILANKTFVLELIDTFGCKHADTLTFVCCSHFPPIPVTTIYQTSCDSFTWICNGVKYTTSGIYYCINPANPCDTSKLVLTILHSTYSISSITVGCSYLWTCNGLIYSTSGVYICTYLNAQGCVHTETLNLTIIPGSFTSLNITACNYYTWTCNGYVYTLSGIYDCIIGCDTTRLHLSILPSTNNTTQVSSCDTYTWSCNGFTYTASGIYYCLNPFSPCDTNKLILTIHNSTSNIISVNVSCEYNWVCNGVTYTSSGTYTCTSLNANGCVHSETLILTVVPSSLNAAYCAAGASINGCLTGDEYIGNVTFNTINNSSSCAMTGQYSNFTCQSTNVTAGQTYTASVLIPNWFNGDQVFIWIDFNQNGVLENSTEQFILGSGGGSGSLPLTALINIPATAMVGATLMRVRANWAGMMSPCGSTAYGEVEDYSVNIIQPSVTNINLKCLIEAFYNSGGNMCAVLENQNQPTSIGVCDSIEIELHNTTAPFESVASATTILEQNGNAFCSISGILGSYYLAIKHRNAIETWSALPVAFTGTTVNYDFTTAANKAYGANQVEVAPGVWAFYSGDLNQDQNADLLDGAILDNSIANFEYGYFATDLNGDGNVDLLDQPILSNNINNFIYSAHP